jgi:hypothetical protein
MDPFNNGTQQLRDTLKECFEQMRFARAAELARSRRYLEAEGLLAPNGRESSAPRDLDLLARISAQQRQYERARRLWETALQQSPGNADYERAIECTKDAERFQAMLRKCAMIALVCLAVAASVIGARKFFHRPFPSSVVEGKKQASSLPATPQPAVATPQPAPATPQPAVATPQPAPATPQPAAATPRAAPATPQPAPATPQPAPTTPQPAPATPQPATPSVAPDSQ